MATNTDPALYSGVEGFLVAQAVGPDSNTHLYMVLYGGVPTTTDIGASYTADSAGLLSYVGLVRFSDLVANGYNPYDYTAIMIQNDLAPYPQDDTDSPPLTSASPLFIYFSDPNTDQAKQIMTGSSDNTGMVVWYPLSNISSPYTSQIPATGILSSPFDPTFYLIPSGSDYNNNDTSTIGTNLCMAQTNCSLVLNYEGVYAPCHPTWNSSGQSSLAWGNGSSNWSGLNIPTNTNEGPNYFIFGFLPIYQQLAPCVCWSSVPSEMCSLPYMPYGQGSSWLSLILSDDSQLVVPNVDGSGTLSVGGNCTLNDANSGLTYYAAEFCSTYCDACSGSGSVGDVAGLDSSKKRQSTPTKKKRFDKKKDNLALYLAIALGASLLAGIALFAIVYSIKKPNLSLPRTQ